MAASYPELAVLAGRVGAPVILDGEIVALRAGRPDFGALQSRMHVRRPPARLIGETPVQCRPLRDLHARSLSCVHCSAKWTRWRYSWRGSYRHPDYQERVVEFNELIANAAIYSTALDITDAANALAAEGHPVDTDDLATITPYITRTIRRFGNWVLNLEPPDSRPVTRLDLQP